jgi:hypothetical protein
MTCVLLRRTRVRTKPVHLVVCNINSLLLDLLCSLTPTLLVCICSLTPTLLVCICSLTPTLLVCICAYRGLGGARTYRGLGGARTCAVKMFNGCTRCTASIQKMSRGLSATTFRRISFQEASVQRSVHPMASSHSSSRSLVHFPPKE